MSNRTAVILLIILFSLPCYAQTSTDNLVPQDGSIQQGVVSSHGYKPREQKLIIDIPLTFAEITMYNLIGNMAWRLWGPDPQAAYFTLDSIRTNLNPRVWSYEKGLGGDNFITNQFFHPYAGAMYFASARSNNFNYYWSILSSTFGSIYWETLGEADSPAKNDLITTASGGIVLGEILHRLYIELDKGGIAGKIGATLLSPSDRITAALRGYGPENSPNKLRGSSLAFGISWINVKFFEYSEKTSSWNQGAAFIGYDLVYGDPFTAHSKTPFDQFDLFTSLTASVPLAYNFNIITNGYLASWLLADDEINQASNGITLNFDDYITNKGTIIDLNAGRDNLNFTANSLGYTIKWRHIINGSLEFSLKTNFGFSPWAVANYNGGITRDDYNLFLFGGNTKLFLELRQMKGDDGMGNGQSLALALCFYDGWKITNTPGPATNTLFLFSKISYSFPLTAKLSLYAADSFMLLHSRLTGDHDAQFPDITRWLNNAQFGIKVSFL